MRNIECLFLILLLSVGTAVANVQAQTNVSQFSPLDQLLVLKNGEVMRGRITRSGDQIILQTEQGSRLVLAADRTEFVCNTLEEAYWGKLARIKASDLAGQKRLFHWCLKQKLLTLAQNQIDILLQTNTKASELEYLDRQLNVALLQQRNIAASNNAANQHKAPNPDDESKGQVAEATAQPRGHSENGLVLHEIQLDESIGNATELKGVDVSVFRPLPSFLGSTSPSIAQLPPANVDSDILPTMDSSVRQVGFEEDIAFDTISLDHKIPNPSLRKLEPEATQIDDRVKVSVHELDRETRSMPAGSIRLYRKRVERVLANGCSAAKCHGPESRVMPLVAFTRGQPIPRRQSQRNLHNLLKYVDRADPFRSRVFLAATEPHAGQRDPILEKGSPHHDNLMKWLIMMSENPQASLNQAMQAQFTQLDGQPVESMPAAVLPVKPEPDPIMAKTEAPSTDFPKTVGEIPKLDTPEQGFKPIDPFDPEIFNRKRGRQND